MGHAMFAVFSARNGTLQCEFQLKRRVVFAHRKQAMESVDIEITATELRESLHCRCIVCAFEICRKETLVGAERHLLPEGKFVLN